MAKVGTATLKYWSYWNNDVVCHAKVIVHRTRQASPHGGAFDWLALLVRTHNASQPIVIAVSLFALVGSEHLENLVIIHVWESCSPP